ncbi:unnamed protein product, partial [Owenia fusiformis]
GKMFCRNGQCLVAVQIVQCRLSCYGPNLERPDHIRPGSIVNVTYHCDFVRRGQFGHQNLTARIRYDKKDLLGKIRGLSPLIFSGYLTKVAKKGEFTANIAAVMKPCVNLKPSCQANRHCYLYAGQK